VGILDGEKSMRKILLLGSFLLLSVLFIGFIVLHTGKLTNPGSLDKTVSQVVTSEPANKPGMPNSAVYYEIKGSSERLSDKERQSIAKWKPEITDFAKQYNNYIYLNGQTTEKIVALTFDDGPDEQVTPKILDILKAYGEHANFFFTGQNVEAFPAVVQRAYMEGNLILNHSYSHPSFYNKTTEFVADEISRTDEIIRNVTGKVPALVRPPYGIVTYNVLKIAEARDDKLIIWSTDTFDWSQKDTTHIAENVLQNVRPGEIVLMHSNSDKTQTEKALPQIIEGLRAKGYKIVLLDYLLNTNAYKN
jgi:peptidoglycan/xylan/chitin deacetylase (PgdA/CDA1 family)